MNQRFGDKRRTELLVGEVLSLEDEDLIEEEEIVITLTNNGYIKRLANNEFRAQRRGGRGVQGMGIHNDDFVKNLVSCSTHDTLLFLLLVTYTKMLLFFVYCHLFECCEMHSSSIHGCLVCLASLFAVSLSA